MPTASTRLVYHKCPDSAIRKTQKELEGGFGGALDKSPVFVMIELVQTMQSAHVGCTQPSKLFSVPRISFRFNKDFSQKSTS